MHRVLIAIAASGLLLSASTAEAKRLKITSATASSEYDEDGTQYPARGVKDSKATTAWYEGDKGNGLGAWVEVSFDGEKDVRKIVVYAGDWKSEQDWTRANRPKELELKYDDDSVETWTLDDEYKPQTYAPSGGKKTSSIRFRLKSIYGGSAFPDTGISEILVYDNAPDADVGGTVTASSEFEPDGNYYYATNTADGLKDTYWCEGQKDGDGVGEWLMVDFGGTKTIRTMEILNGMGTSMALHKKGAVASKATLQFSNGSTKTVDLQAKMPLVQKVQLGSVSTSSVKITFDEVRKGAEYNDMCVSELRFLP